MTTARSLDLLLRDLSADDITPVFQPIVDLFTGSVIGHELLARGPAPFEAPAPLFARARELGLTWELEQACRSAALARLSRECARLPGCRWFLNVGLDTFLDPRLLDDLAPATLHAAGIDPSSLVLEITERESIADHQLFQQTLRSYSARGFRIALDDFGSGHNGLVTLVSCAPHVIKLDMELTRDVNRHPYKQTIVRSVVSLASAVDAQLIAEGVENWQELEMLVRQGIRFAQGKLLAMPLAEPAILDDAHRRALLETITRCNPVQSNVEETVARLAVQTVAIERGTMSCEELESRMHADPRLDCAVLVRHGRPEGLITRTHLFSQMSGRFGYSLVQKQRIEALAKPHPLLVDRNASIVRLATLAMERPDTDLYDPVIVVDERGTYCGTVSMKQLIIRSAELEIEQARESNPLTMLPGNRAIRGWISSALAHGGTVIYADLDYFKEFNDAFGFILGDEAIRLTGRILTEHLDVVAPGARLGHLGGDDFVIVSWAAVSDDALETLCSSFDREKAPLFDEATRVAGCFSAIDRLGQRRSVPLTTLSLAVVPGPRLGIEPHPATLSQTAAAVKRKAKERSLERRRSSFVIFE